MEKKTKNILQSLFWTGVAVLLLVFCLRGIDWDRFADALRQCRWGYVLLAMLAGAANFWFRGARWGLLLRSIDPGISDLTAFNAYNIANASNLVIPRSGELVRLGVVVRHSAKDSRGQRLLSFDKALGTVVVERLWDGIIVLLMTGVLLALHRDTFGAYLGRSLSAVDAEAVAVWGAVGVLLLAALLFWAARFLKGRLREKLRTFLAGIRKGLVSSLHMKKVWHFLAYTALVWICYWLICLCILLALKDIDVFAARTPADAFLLMVAGTLSSVIPVPGGFGAYHGVVGGVLQQLWGVPMSLGMIYATLNHESHVLVQVLLGLGSYLHESFFKKKARMKRFAIIGHPVAGSMSPVLFTAAYAGRYPYDLIDEEHFEQAWNRFLADYDGINVTAPYKQDAFARVDHCSETARRSGAVNLVVKTPEGLSGYNTDVLGVLETLKTEVKPGMKLLVVGSGGAARAAVVAAQLLDCEVTVAARNADKAAGIAAATGCRSIGLEEAGKETPDVLVYTLPASAPVPSGLPFAGAVVLEAEYKRPQLESIPCRRYLSGKLWLVHQALSGYALFTGEEPDAEKIWKTINK